MCICVQNEREIWLLFKESRRVLAAACVYVVFIKQCNVYIRPGCSYSVYFPILCHYDVMSIVKLYVLPITSSLGIFLLILMYIYVHTYALMYENI